MTYTIFLNDLDFDLMNQASWILFDEPAQWVGDMTSYNLEIEIKNYEEFMRCCVQLTDAGIEYTV